MDAGRVLHYTTIAFHCQVSSGSVGYSDALRRDEGAHSRVSESTVLCSERFLRKIFTFLLVPKSLWTLPLPIQWQSKESWSLPESRCSAIGVFFFCPQLEVSVTCAGLQWNEHGLRSRERHGPGRKRAVDSCWPNDETTLYRNLVEHERLQRKRSKVRAANTRCRPTCDVGQHAVCIQTGLQKK